MCCLSHYRQYQYQPVQSSDDVAPLYRDARLVLKRPFYMERPWVVSTNLYRWSFGCPYPTYQVVFSLVFRTPLQHKLCPNNVACSLPLVSTRHWLLLLNLRNTIWFLLVFSCVASHGSYLSRCSRCSEFSLSHFDQYQSLTVTSQHSPKIGMFDLIDEFLL